jgi:cellulose synthase/poly-beta-1,6-N-acetylglucosamine synthase-like glycosyltransferase
MTVIDAQRGRERVAHGTPVRVGGAASLPPLAPHAPGLFSPAYPARWAVLSSLAVLATATVGVAIPQVLDSLIAVALAPLRGGEMMPWVRPTLWAGYALFVTLVVFPFLIFLAWSWAGRPAAGAAFPQRWPRVSILIPAYNEQEIILDAVHGALNQDYPDFEVIVIDDGSTDMTAHLATTTVARLIRHERNRGKAAALNSGVAAAHGEVIVTCDADGYLDPRALRHLVAPLVDPRVGGVAGQVRLFHPRGTLRRFQVLEYDYGQGLLKLAQFASAGTVLVAPGPVSAYRADVLHAVGGVPGDTLTEDFDLTLRVIGHGLRIAYAPRAVAYTEAPRTDAELRRQRLRWGRGGLQVLRKHRAMIAARPLGLVGLFWLPYSYWTWYAAVPVALTLTALAPLLVWGSGAPLRFLACLAVYGLAGAVVEVAKVAAGVLASDWRDLRFLAHAPLFLAYKKLRLDWFPAEAFYREWRQAPRGWHG